MTKLKRFEVYWAKVEFRNKIGSKVRPITIVNDKQDYVTAILITTHEPRIWDKFDYKIRKYKKAGLKEKSTARTAKKLRLKIYKQYIFDKIGELDIEDKIQIKKLLNSQ